MSIEPLESTLNDESITYATKDVTTRENVDKLPNSMMLSRKTKDFAVGSHLGHTPSSGLWEADFGNCPKMKGIGQ
jgi:hypothetical protein